jgi:peptidoglycan hydrolase CwlO-like protein
MSNKQQEETLDAWFNTTSTSNCPPCMEVEVRDLIYMDNNIQEKLNYLKNFKDDIYDKLNYLKEENENLKGENEKLKQDIIHLKNCLSPLITKK